MNKLCEEDFGNKESLEPKNTHMMTNKHISKIDHTETLLNKFRDWCDIGCPEI